jgi:peptide/nickel transport system ATP-binding protein
MTKNSRILKAVDDVSFFINEGEILGLAGESGCGKSTAALAIPNLLPDKAKIIHGEIIYKNMPLTSMSEKELRCIRGREITNVFQEYRQSLNPLMKAGRQISESLELKERENSKDRQDNKGRVLELLALLGFDEPEKTYDSYPHQLSGGMCQRVMAAVAAIGRPSLMLADEPSTALDAQSKARILCMLAKMNRDYGSSILVISHDLSIIRQFCSRYLIMYAGKIVEEGPSSLLASPLHPYTKALAAAIPDKSKKGGNLETIPGKVPSVEDDLSGCPFAPRCKKAQSICKESFPPATEITISDDIVKRKVHCYYHDIGDNNV